jgi:cytochrome P450
MRSYSPGFRPPRPTPRLRQLGPIALLNTIIANPIECWTEEHFQKPIVVGGFPFARVAVLNDPAAIRKVLVENPNAYRKGTLERRVLSARLRNGLAAVDGEQWASQRRTLAPLFGRKTVIQFAPAMADAAAALVKRWHNRPPGDAIDIKIEMDALALDVLTRSIFHAGLGGDPEAVHAAMVSFFATAGRIDLFDLIGLPDTVPRITQWRMREVLRTFEQALDAAIANRRSNLDEHPADAARDVLDTLLAAKDPETERSMNDAEVKANVLTFFFAGQESTATALTWATYLLSQSPAWSARVTAEAERELSSPFDGAADRLHETRAVIDEAMRLYPPFAGMTRTASRRDELAGRTIERGTMIVISPYVLHRHHLLWDDPDLFDPGRFLDGAPRKNDRYAYLPFGVGPRMCIGAGFALQEATIVLATIMKHFTLTLTPGQSVWPLQRFTLRPRDPLLMIVKRRD